MRSIIPNMLQLSVVGYPFVNPGPVGGVGTFKNEQAGKVEKILKGSLNLNQSPSPSVKIQIIVGKVCLMCKGKILLGVVNKLFVFKSLLTTPSNVLS